MSWGSAQEGLPGLIRQASCSVAVQLLVQLSRTVMRSQFVVLIASLGLGSWPDSSRLRAFSVSTTVSIPTSGRAGSGLDQGYPGGTQHALAEVSPPHLATMIPIDSLSNCGVSGMRHGGAFGLRIRQHADSLPLRTGTTPLRVVPEYEAWLVEAMRNGPEAPFWHTKGMSVVDHIKDYADVPVLHITGWYDSWTRQVIINYEALSRAKKSPQRLVIGPWTHG